MWNIIIFVLILFPENQMALIVFPFFNNLFGNICHQNPEKLFLFENGFTLVCARCSGIYLGSFFSSFALFFYQLKKDFSLKLLIWISIPILLDVLTNLINIKEYDKTSAFITGLLFGSVAFLYFYDGLKKVFNKSELK